MLLGSSSSSKITWNMHPWAQLSFMLLSAVKMLYELETAGSGKKNTRLFISWQRLFLDLCWWHGIQWTAYFLYLLQDTATTFSQFWMVEYYDGRNLSDVAVQVIFTLSVYLLMFWHRELFFTGTGRIWFTVFKDKEQCRYPCKVCRYSLLQTYGFSSCGQTDDVREKYSFFYCTGDLF